MRILLETPNLDRGLGGDPIRNLCFSIAKIDKAQSHSSDRHFVGRLRNRPVGTGFSSPSIPPPRDHLLSFRSVAREEIPPLDLWIRVCSDESGDVVARPWAQRQPFINSNGGLLPLVEGARRQDRFH